MTAQKKVDVVGHQNIAANSCAFLSRFFYEGYEFLMCLWIGQNRLTVMGVECDEV